MVKFLTVIFVMMAAASAALAQTPVPKDMANNYFANCLKAPNQQQVTPQTQQMLCACTAARLTQYFTVEDMKSMADPGQVGRNALNKMLVNIYAPCMEFPAREHYYNTCMSNSATASVTNNPQKVCGCLGDQMAMYLKVHGPSVFEQILSRNPNVTDPMQALTDDSQFQQYAQSKLLTCMK